MYFIINGTWNINFVSCESGKMALINCVRFLANCFLQIPQKFNEFNWSDIEFTVVASSTTLENFELIYYIVLNNTRSRYMLQNTDT